MLEPTLFDRVRLTNTGDSKIEGQTATIYGFHGKNFPIVLFDSKPVDYNPAIVITAHCLEKI